MKYIPFELHTHTIHSDGSFEPRDLVYRVKNAGLRGFALTDHNTSSGCFDTSSEAQKERLVFLPGTEWTTFYGHMTLIGGNFDPDYRQVNPFTVESRIRLAKEAGDVTFLAHPFRVGTPVCTGCSDEFQIKDYSHLTGYEVWSGEFPGRNESNKNAEKKFKMLCADGFKLAVVYGRDWHRDGKDNSVYAATYIGVEEEDERSVMEGLKEKRTFISTGLRAIISLKDVKGNLYPIGSTVGPGKYVLVCEFSKDAKCYKDVTVIPQFITLLGNSLDDEETSNVSFGGYSKAIELKKGFFMLKVSGTINGLFSDILISSPFFVRS